jgi:serine/threonine protein kinase
MSEGDLFDYTKKNGFLEEYVAAIIFRQLVDTVIYVNDELGIIHRDLKPENVLVPSLPRRSS